MNGLDERDRLDVLCALRLGEVVVRKRATATANVALRLEREAKADRMARLRASLEGQAEVAA